MSKGDGDTDVLAATIVEQIDLADLLAEMHKPLEDSLSEIGSDIVTQSLASIGVKAESDLVNRVDARAVAYAQDRAAELVAVDGEQSLVITTRNVIRDIISRGLADNIGKDEIATNIEQSMAFSEARATLIANTEVAMANSYSKNESWNEVRADGVTLVKEWFVSEDEGVCEECEANAEQGEIAYDSEFDSGDTMEPAHPGCRCVTVARSLDAGETDDSGDGE